MFADGVGLLLLMSWFRNRIWMVVNDFNSLFNQPFNNFNIPIFIRRAERKGNTRFSCPTSSTYSVYICFRNVWNVKINNGIYIDNVNSTRSYICCDQNSCFLIFKILNSFISDTLSFISMNTCYFVPIF